MIAHSWLLECCALTVQARRRCVFGHCRSSLADRMRVPMSACWTRSSRPGKHRARSRSEVSLSAALILSGALSIASFRRPAHCSVDRYERRSDGSLDRLKRWSTKPWNLPGGTDPGWHVIGPHPLLQKHLRRLKEPKGLGNDADRVSVLVPLCGMTCDMPFLCEEGFGVVGVEGVSRAIFEFRSTHRNRIKGFNSRIVMSVGPDGVWSEGPGFEPASKFSGERVGRVFKAGEQGLGYYNDFPSVWRGYIHVAEQVPQPLHLVHGDMFDMTPSFMAAATFSDEGMFDIVYDRASLVSIPPTARQEFVYVLNKLLRPEGRIFLIAEDYDQSLVPVDTQGRRRGPPPFALPEAEVRQLFPSAEWSIEILDRVPSELPEGGNPSFHGVEVSEVVYLLTKRARPAATRGRTLTYLTSAVVVALVAAVATLREKELQ